MKERLQDTLGAFGIILFYILVILFSVAPLLVLNFPLWVDLIIIIVLTVVPIVSELGTIALYIWAFFVAIKSPSEITSIVFFIMAVIFLIVDGIPFIKAIIGKE